MKCGKYWFFTIVLMTAIAAMGQSVSSSGEKEAFGAEANPTGDPIGGGQGYGRLVSRIDYRVKTLEELLGALEKARSGEVVYVNDKVEIDLTGRQKIVIPGQVTLASGRGRNNSQGALLYSNQLKTHPLFLTGGKKVRVTGLRLRGPDPQRRTEQMRKLSKEGKYYSIPNSCGILSKHSHLEVDNCELWAWSHAAVSIRLGATDAHIHHNNIHHNQRSGLGYGVSLDRANALIEANLFDWCRHHIAGTGHAGTSYEARYNLVLKNANSHSFDMHGARDFEKRALNALWSFDEGSGNAAKDSSIYPHKNDGTLVNMNTSTCWVQGRLGQSLRFDGQDDYIDCGNDKSLSTAKGLTIMAWIKPAKLNSVQTIISKGLTGMQGSGYNMRLVNDQVETTIYDSRGNLQTALSGNLKADKWYHIVLAHDGSNVKIYINAELVNSFACDGIKHSQLNFIIGKNSTDDTSHFKGIIDEARLYNRAMGKENIERNYNGYGDIAGNRLNIHHNTFQATDVRAIVIRGKPTQEAQIHHNWFWHADINRTVQQVNAEGNIKVYRNQFTRERVLINKGIVTQGRPYKQKTCI